MRDLLSLLPPRVLVNTVGPLPTAEEEVVAHWWMSLVDVTPPGEADGISASSADGHFCALRVCRHPNWKDEPVHPAEDNHGNQDQPPPCCPEVSSIPAKSRQRKSHWDLQTNSWWQQITKGKLHEHVSTVWNPGNESVIWARLWHWTLWLRSPSKSDLFPRGINKSVVRRVASRCRDRCHVILPHNLILDPAGCL